MDDDMIDYMEYMSMRSVPITNEITSTLFTEIGDQPAPTPTQQTESNTNDVSITDDGIEYYVLKDFI